MPSLPIRTLLAAVAVAGAVLVPGAGGTGTPFVQIDLSRDNEIQAETAVAVDPSNPEILLGGSNSFDFFKMPVYSSTDGGATWTSTKVGPPTRKSDQCVGGDPAVGIAADGTQYYAFLFGDCFALFEEDAALDLSIGLARRRSASAPWTTRVVVPHKRIRFDDKPALAVDAGSASATRGRVYVAWTLFDGVHPPRIMISHTDSGGATWSPLKRVDDGRAFPTFASIAVGPTGTVYVAWVGTGDVYVDRALDGERFGRDRRIDNAIGIPDTVSECGFPLGTTAIPAQPQRCVTPAPLVTVDDSGGPRAGTVYVTYGAAGEGGRQQDVFVAAHDAALKPLLGKPAGMRLQVNPPDGRIPFDQFLPASAVDRVTGDLWICFYDTTGDRHRIKSWYSCTASADGGATWAKPVRAASVSSNETVRRASFFEFGDYEGLAVANGNAHPFWTDSRDLATRREEIYTTTLTRADLQLP